MAFDSNIQLTVQYSWQSWGVDVRAGYCRCTTIE